MQTNSMKWFLLFSLIHVLEGSRILWKLNEFVPLEKTVKIILESCYKNVSSSNPILILENFNEFIENPSTIRINNFAAFPSDGSFKSFDFRASRIILAENSSDRLYSHLKQLAETNWWNYMTSFFIIAKYQNGCEDFKYSLNLSWSKNMINSIYICAESLNSSVLYTLNSMANYAPYPWERMEKGTDLNVFRQVFDERISCDSLNFDKTRHLNGYKINVVGKRDTNLCSFGQDHNCKYGRSRKFLRKPLELIIKALNVSNEFEDEEDLSKIRQRSLHSKLDITSDLYGVSSLLNESCFLLSYARLKFIVVVKLEPEVTTLHKISKLWSFSVLIAASIALAFLFFILMIKNHDFSFAMLDIVRLLTYAPIETNDRTHAFRIYFTTMLIFMVISNGVFQGKIAAFLTTREKAPAIGTINELADLGYKMSANGYSDRWLKKCPKCNFKPVSVPDCVQHVLNDTHHLCVMWETPYHEEYSKLDLDHIPDIVEEKYLAYECGRHWPLVNRFSDGLLRLFQSGILDHWENGLTHVPKRKRMTREAEWSSAEYRPIKFYKLQFAFQLLILGLLISTIVFIWELVRYGYGTTRKSSIVQPVRRNQENSTTKEIILSLRYRRSIILNGYFSKYPLTIRQDYMSRVRGISQSINNDTYQAKKFTVFRKKISSLQSFPKNSK